MIVKLNVNIIREKLNYICNKTLQVEFQGDARQVSQPVKRAHILYAQNRSGDFVLPTNQSPLALAVSCCQSFRHGNRRRKLIQMNCKKLQNVNICVGSN